MRCRWRQVDVKAATPHGRRMHALAVVVGVLLFGTTRGFWIGLALGLFFDDCEHFDDLQ